MIFTGIYIPLCLYLYQTPATARAATTAFTFHYVYIYIFSHSSHFPRWYIDLHSTMFIFIFAAATAAASLSSFTFHYVYIYIIGAATTAMASESFTFHYVYIYMQKDALKKGSACIYIPLCLYLYLIDYARSIHRYPFTFHYVYIYIQTARGIEVKNKDLHSTMFIFICNCG